MLRISNLLRSKDLHRALARGGGGGWDRPDVPPTAYVPKQHEIKEQDICWVFHDHAMSEHLISNNEIFIGDTFDKYFPQFLKYLGGLLGVVAALALLNYTIQPGPSFALPNRLLAQLYEEKKARLQNKFYYNQAQSNPMGITLTRDTLAHAHTSSLSEIPPQFAEDHKREQIRDKINHEVGNYLRRIKQKAADKVAKGDSHHDSHSAHH